MQHLVDNRYRLVWTLSSDGMAEVHLARDDILGRDIVLKILGGRYTDDEKTVELFRNEARNAAALSHPNIVSVFDQGRTEDGAYYIAMEYMPGGNLKERLKKLGPLSARRAAAVALQIAKALKAAHEGGVVHGELRPSNVLITETGNVKVKDFGIAKAAAEASSTQRDSYRAPERADGGEASRAGDLYSLGVIFHEMIAGEPPADRTGKSKTGGSVPGGAGAVVAALMSEDPDDRYADTEALIEDLERIEAGLQPVNVGADESAQVSSYESYAPRRSELRRGRGRGRVLLLVLPLLAILLLSGVAWAGFGLLRTSPQAQQTQQSEPRPEPRQDPKPVMLQVPDLGGMKLEEARKKVGDDFEVVEDGRKNGSKPENTILSQKPSDGEAEQGTEIRAVLASGENEVPSVENSVLEEAQKALSDAGFEATVLEAESAAGTEGLVLSQSPASGGTTGLGSPVEIVVGTGPAPVEVPSLYGYTRGEAAAQVESLGLVFGGSDTAPSDEVAKGGVIAQSFAPGTLVEPGTVVGVTISSGPREIPVPNVVGLTLDQARQKLSGAGFAYNELEIPNAQWPRGTVLYTDPGTGAPLVPGSTVTIGYSSGPSAQPAANDQTNQNNQNNQSNQNNRQSRNRASQNP